VLTAAETARHHAALALRWDRVHLDSCTLKPRSAGSVTGDIYRHTSDDTARAAIDHLSGALGR
jgi:integrase